MTADSGRRDADPFADFRPGGTSVRPDDRLEVHTHYDVSVQDVSVRDVGGRDANVQGYQPSRPQTVPQSALQHPDLATDLPPQVPERSSGQASVAAGDTPRPMTRREAREAEARRTGQQPQVVPPRRPESPPQGPPTESEPDDTQPQQVQRVEVPRDDRLPDAGYDAVPAEEYREQHDHHDVDVVDGQHEPLYHDDDVFHGYVDGYDDDDLRAERATVESEGKRRKSRGPLRFLVLLAVLAALGLGGYAAWIGLQPAIQSVRDQFAPAADFPGPGGAETTIRINSGDGSTVVGQSLVDAGVVASVDAFVNAAKARDSEWRTVQPGDYRLNQQISGDQAVTALLDPSRKIVNRVTIPEGRRTVDILTSLSEQTGIPVEDFTAAALSLPLPAQAALNLPPEQRPPNTVGDTEGWLFPETYDLGLEPTAQSILDQMLARTQAVLTEQGVPADQWLVVLTKASLVQAEARLPEDFGRVARVTENRLTLGVPTADGSGTIQRIQYDSTTIYAAGRANGVPDRTELDSLNPYNTRAVDGLPPGAINNPGLQAIQAVLNPTPGDWLFFTTIDLCTGETLFQATSEAATQDAAQFQEWEENAPRDADGNIACP